MFDFHKDKSKAFSQQYRTTVEYIMPFIAKDRTLDPSLRILEIGCGEAGVLKAFAEKGFYSLGIELSEKRVELAKVNLADEIAAGHADVIASNIYDINPETDLDGTFDVILLKDVIEHIPDQGRFLNELHRFLSPGGMVFFGFPPWQMPFGGHQQVCKGKIMSTLPYYHLLPMPLYMGILKLFGETEVRRKNLREIKETGLSIERFERIVSKNNYRTVRKQHFLINPIYTYKFGMRVRKQSPLISGIPYLRNFLTTCVYYTITPKA